MKSKIINVLFYVIAAFYVFMLVDLFFRFNVMFEAGRTITRSYNLVPFRTIWEYISGNNQVSQSFVVSNILGNIVVFIPCGLYLQVIQRRRGFLKSLLILVALSVAIESIQYIFGLGASDIDDVLLNTCGGVIGVLLYALLRKIFKADERTKTAITILSVVVGVPIIYLYFTTVFNHLRL